MAAAILNDWSRRKTSLRHVVPAESVPDVDVKRA